jgi:Tfp pilus assembly protein PilF
MQINGFLRIYDAKAKSIHPATARLDMLMCLAWFGAAILHSPAKEFSLLSQFYASGGFLIPPGAFVPFRTAWDAGTAAVTLLFLANAQARAKAGNPASPIKFLAMASGFGFWWYCTAALDNLMLGVMLWEVFHDAQYNVLVWLFERQRVDRGLNAGRAEKLLFGRGPARLALYAFLILAYGCIGIASSFGDIHAPEKAMLGSGAPPWLLRAAIASALLHFYFDGFIWKMRERGIRMGLGVKDGGKAVDAVPRSAFRHAWLWALFIAPVALLGFTQFSGRGADLQAQVLNLSEAVPESWIANFLSGTYYKGQGRFEEAERRYRRVVARNPGFAMGQLFLGDILYKRGNRAEALEHYRLSVAADSANPEARMNLGFLYLGSGKPAEAAVEFRAALDAFPDNPDLAFGLASALLQSHRLPEARTYLERTLHSSPNHSGALNYIGVIREYNGDAQGAVEYYRRALAADTANGAARANLSAALSRQASSPAQARPAP